MAGRRAHDGKGKFKYNYTPPNCDGFNVTWMCREHDRDCRHGSCWHMDRVRQMVRRWFVDTFSRPASVGWWERRPDPEFKPTPKEAEEALQLATVSGIVCARRHFARYGHVPDRRHDWGTNGIGWSPYPDEDGVGSWGRVVRIVEDNR